MDVLARLVLSRLAERTQSNYIMCAQEWLLARSDLIARGTIVEKSCPAISLLPVAAPYPLWAKDRCSFIEMLVTNASTIPEQPPSSAEQTTIGVPF